MARVNEGSHSFTCHQGRNHWGVGGVRTPPNLDGPPQLFDEECDYRYVTDCSPRKWVYHPYFVLYNNLDHGIGPPTLKTWLRPCLPPTRLSTSGMNHACLYSPPQSVTALCPVLIFRSAEGRRLSSPEWLVTNRGGLPAGRQSPIPVLTRPGVE